MKPEEIKGMVEALGPVLRNKTKAQTLLQKYWQNKQVIVWTVDQIHRAANERGRVLTNNDARELLHQFIRLHNPQYGIQWRDLLEMIDQSALGRKISKVELKAFIEKDRLCIQRRTT